jgi:hypothetical protein
MAPKNGIIHNYRDQKPRKGSALDRTHPLAAGLIVALPLNEQIGDTVFDHAKGRVFKYVDLNPIWNKEGSLDLSRDLQAVRGGSTALLKQEGTLVLGLRKDSSFSSGAYHVFARAYATASSADWNYQYHRVGNDWYQRIGDTTGWITNQPWFEAADNIHRWHMTWRWNAKTPRREIRGNVYQHVHTNTSAFTFPYSNLAVGGFEFGTAAASGNYMGCHLFYAYVYDRELSVQELAWLMAQPYDMFQERRHYIVGLMPAGPLSITPTAVKSGVGFGDITITLDTANVVQPTAIKSGVGFEDPTVTLDTASVVTPTAIKSGVGTEDPTVTLDTANTIQPDSIKSGVGFGDITADKPIYLTAGDLKSGIGFGDITASLDTANIVQPEAIKSGIGFGDISISKLILVQPDSIKSGIGLKDPTVTLDTANVVQPTALKSGIGYEDPTVALDTANVVQPDAIKSGVGFASITVTLASPAAGIVAYRRPRFDPTQKPPRGTQINREHSLSRGLIVSLPLNEVGGGSVWDHASKASYIVNPPASWNKDGSITCDADFACIQGPVGSGGLLKPEGTVIFKLGRTKSYDGLMYFVHCDDAPASDDFAFYYVNSGNDFYFEMNSDGDVVEYDNTFLELQSYGTTDVVSLRWHDDNNFRELRFNVSEQAHSISASFSFPTSDLAKSKLTFGGDPNITSRAIEAKIFYAHVYDRMLDPAELQQLMAEPFAMYDPQRIWIMGAPAEGVVTPDAVKSGLGFGDLTIAKAALTITPTAIKSGVGFENPTVTLDTANVVGPDVVKSGLGFADPTIAKPIYLTVGDLKSGVGFGDITVALDTANVVQPNAIKSGVGFEEPTVTLDTANVIQPTAIKSGLGFADPTIAKAALTVTPTVLKSGVGFGDIAVNLAGVQTVGPNAVKSGVGFGDLTITQAALTVEPAAIKSGVGFEDPTVVLDTANVVQPNAVKSGIGFGDITVTSVLTAKPTAIKSGVGFGDLNIDKPIYLTAGDLKSGVGLADPTVALAGVTVVYPDSIKSGVGFGAPTITSAAWTVQPDALKSGLGFADPTIAKASLTVQPTSIKSGLGYGQPTITLGTALVVAPTAVKSGIGVDGPTVTLGTAFVVAPDSIKSGLGIADPTVVSAADVVQPTALKSGVAFGVCSVTGPIIYTPIEVKVYNTLAASTALDTIVNGEIYPGTRFQGADLPAIIFDRVSGYRVYSMSGYSKLENPRFQFDLYSTSLDEIVEMTDTLYGALSSATNFKAMPDESPQDEWDDTTEIYHRVIDISLWNREER